MLRLPPTVRIYLCLEHADMRRSFDGLSRMVREIVGEDPLSGHLFVFRNRRGDRMKILYWDRDGFALWYKRLEKGSFSFPTAEAGGLSIDVAELTMILEGIDVSGAKRQKRFENALI